MISLLDVNREPWWGPRKRTFVIEPYLLERTSGLLVNFTFINFGLSRLVPGPDITALCLVCNQSLHFQSNHVTECTTLPFPDSSHSTSGVDVNFLLFLKKYI